jgi:hypothetical protein
VAPLFNRERVLFRTHQPPFRAPQWVVGALVDHEGTLYRITRWRELRPVTLERGGSVQEWEVLGRKASGKEVRDELANGAESLLRDEGAGGGPDRP